MLKQQLLASDHNSVGGILNEIRIIISQSKQIDTQCRAFEELDMTPLIMTFLSVDYVPEHFIQKEACWLTRLT